MKCYIVSLQPFCSFYRHAIDNIKPLQDKETRQRQCCQSTAMRNKMGNAQSANCLPVNKSKHGILEVPEETDSSGITSVKKISFLSM
ncbi:hypothetical protein T05_4102 [Trichinella murrelli]|uniref:Uncharacterized protein n=1 Tax=Trichinella murrelli TaxID=144512 RepID=A0A0V0TNC4_9BILA|nr:hypothetical protein T05_4102 [Trichinella murrelli]